MTATMMVATHDDDDYDAHWGIQVSGVLCGSGWDTWAEYTKEK
jgi:hypothetical protein